MATMAGESPSPSVSASSSSSILASSSNSFCWHSPTVVFRTTFLCVIFFLLGLQTNSRPVTPRNNIIAEVLWGTAVARSHISSFLPKTANITMVNAALRSAILADHTAFVEGLQDDEANVNDAFFSRQTGEGANGAHDVTSLRHRNLKEFMHVSRAVATVAGRLLSLLGEQNAGKQGATERRLQAWATVHVGGSAHEMHVHDGAAVGAVYYVTVPPDGGVLRLYDPRGPRPPFDGVVEIRPREGEIIAFPGWVVHEVAPGGEGERISVAFNVPGTWVDTTEVAVGKIGLGLWEKGEGGWTLDWSGPL